MKNLILNLHFHHVIKIGILSFYCYTLTPENIYCIFNHTTTMTFSSTYIDLVLQPFPNTDLFSKIISKKSNLLFLLLFTYFLNTQNFYLLNLQYIFIASAILIFNNLNNKKTERKKKSK